VVARNLAELLIGGRIADSVDAAVVLFGGSLSLGVFLGAMYAWLSDARPRWQQAMGLGTVIGGLVGTVLTVIDGYIG
jgi:hypothetical protein